MKPQYREWIEHHAPRTPEEARGKCAEVTADMQKEFPELTRVRGHYYCHIWGERKHWWLIDRDSSEIVDPTVIQFPSKGHGHYEPWDEGEPEPTGRCPNCGQYCYTGRLVARRNATTPTRHTAQGGTDGRPLQAPTPNDLRLARR